MANDADDEFALTIEDVPEPSMSGVMSATKIIHGKLIPAQQQILLYSADDWERFIEEWVHYQWSQYNKITRLSGSKDMGIDVAGFVDDCGFNGVWDNFQCKHYDKALTPGTAIPEIGKCLWHSFKGRFVPPRKYCFMAPKDCGMNLKKLLLNIPDLKGMVFARWDSWCAKSITSTETIALEGEFREYAEAFNFSIFTFKPTLDAIDEHRKTPYHAARFGGGLPDRPDVEKPPGEPSALESRYIQQLFEAYGDHKHTVVARMACLSEWPDLQKHYHRQREFFYHAESLRNFARDAVPPGTYEDLQEEVHAGVVELEAAPQPDAFFRVNAVTQAAAQLSLTANGLISVTKVQDRRGICHQLANEDRLHWVKG